MRFQSLRVALVALVAGSAFHAIPSVGWAAPFLMVDVNDDDAGADGNAVQGGFESFTYLVGGRTINGVNYASDNAETYNVNVSAVGGTIDDRDRNFSAPAEMTYTELYDDFIFNNSNTGTLTLKVSGPQLLPNTQYAVSLYAYDHGSGPNSSGLDRRTADWRDRNNGNAYVLTTNFKGASTSPAFAGEVPATNDANKFTGVALTDASGVLFIEGVNTTWLDPTTNLPRAAGVFLSGFEVSAVPEPTTAMGLIGLAGLVLARRRPR
jgi:hypothetical protein